MSHVPWEEKVRRLRVYLDREPTLEELLALAAKHGMSESEIEAQRRSWVRANTPTGDERFD